MKRSPLHGRVTLWVNSSPPIKSAFNAIKTAIRKALYIRQQDYEVVLLRDQKILVKLRNKIDGERALHKQLIIIYNSLLIFTEWDHVGEANDIEPTEYKMWVTLFQFTLGFFTPAIAEDLFKILTNNPSTR